MRRIFDVCEPRADVLKGVTDADFAADLAKVIRGVAPEEYLKPNKFFATTYPTRGLQNLLANVCARLTGTGKEVASIFRLDTSYGGGKTHGLIALVHAANGMQGVSNISEFIDPALVPTKKVRVAAFDGENADPANGRSMGDAIWPGCSKRLRSTMAQLAPRRPSDSVLEVDYGRVESSVRFVTLPMCHVGNLRILTVRRRSLWCERTRRCGD